MSLLQVDTPLAPYFSDNLTSEDLDEMNIEVRGWVWVCGWGRGSWHRAGGDGGLKSAGESATLRMRSRRRAACLRAALIRAPIPAAGYAQPAVLGSFAGFVAPSSDLIVFLPLSCQVMRNTLYKAYLDDFASFVHRVGGTTGEIMSELLSFEVRGVEGRRGEGRMDAAERGGGRDPARDVPQFCRPPTARRSCMAWPA